MARFIIQNRITTPEYLSDFDTGGYKYQKELSSSEKLVFLKVEISRFCFTETY